MAFMEPQIEFGEWYEVDTSNGISFIPADVVGKLPIAMGETLTEDSPNFEACNVLADYLETCCEVYSIGLREGWGARLSAPGYLDCTEWSVFDTEQEASDYLDETFGEDEDDSEDA